MTETVVPVPLLLKGAKSRIPSPAQSNELWYSINTAARSPDFARSRVDPPLLKNPRLQRRRRQGARPPTAHTRGHWPPHSHSQGMACRVDGGQQAQVLTSASCCQEADPRTHERIIFMRRKRFQKGSVKGQKAWPTQSMGSSMVARRRAPVQGPRMVQQNHQGAGRDLVVFNRHAGKQRNRSADVTSCAVRRLHKGCVLAFMPAEMEGVNPDDD